MWYSNPSSSHPLLMTTELWEITAIKYLTATSQLMNDHRYISPLLPAAWHALFAINGCRLLLACRHICFIRVVCEESVHGEERRNPWRSHKEIHHISHLFRWRLGLRIHLYFSGYFDVILTFMPVLVAAEAAGTTVVAHHFHFIPSL